MSRSFRFPPILVPSLLLLASSSLAAQGQPEQGGFIARLGNDTVAVEQFTRTAGRLEGDVVQRTPRTRTVHYVVTHGSDGAPTSMEVTVTPAAPGSPPGIRATMGLKGDSVHEDLRLGDSSWTVTLAAGATPIPMVSFSCALWEPAVSQTLRSGQDSLPFAIVFPGSENAFPSSVAKRGGDSVMISYFGFPAYARIDKSGRIMHWNGSGTTVKVQVDRVAQVDIRGFVTRFAAADAAGQSLGQLSPRDTVRAVVAGDSLWVDYGRPSMRGRVIFGNVVPWGQVWRTGANAATQFKTDRALDMGGATVPAGTYTLWTIPSQAGAKLVINQQVGQWGTDYDESKDLVRIDLQTETLAQPVEQFTIQIVSKGAGGEISFSWATTRYFVPFTLK